MGGEGARGGGAGGGRREGREMGGDNGQICGLKLSARPTAKSGGSSTKV